MSDLPYPEDPGRTHWDGCWREPGHHNCAIRKVDPLLTDGERITGTAYRRNDFSFAFWPGRQFCSEDGEYPATLILHTTQEEP